MTRRIRRALRCYVYAYRAYGHPKKKAGKRGASKARRKVGKAICTDYSS